MAQFGDITSDDVVTKATILVANAVSEGAIVSAGYVPSLITHSYTHPEHAEWKAERSFSIEEKDGRAVLDVLSYTRSTGFGWGSGTSGWQSSVVGKSVAEVASDGNTTTYAYPGSVSPGLFSLTEFEGQRFVGIAVVIDAPAGSYGLKLTIFYQNSDGGSNRVTHYEVQFPLDQVKGQGKVEYRNIAPVPVDARVNTVEIRLIITGDAPTVLKVYEFRGLQANQILLTQIARAQIRLPAKEVSEVAFVRGVDPVSGILYGAHLLEQPAKRLNLLSDTGKNLGLGGDVAEVVDTYTTEEGMLSRVALGQAIRNPIIRALTR